VLATLSRWRSRVQIPSGPLSTVPGQVAQLVEHTTENRGVGGSIPPLTTHAPTLVLLCAPSLGILDNWLPVLHAARASDPDLRIVALIPDRETLAQLEPEDTAHVLADEVIDATVAPLVGGGWVLAEGFLGARDAARPRGPLRSRPTRAQRRARVEPSQLAGPGTRLLYDIHLHDKQRVQPLLKAMGATPRFSHNHGIELEVVDAGRVAPPDPENVHAAFLYGPSEVEAYTRNFGLDPASLHVVGVARHDPAWVQKVVERSEALHRLPFDEHVLVVSRPAGSSYLPHDRKVAALRALHQVAWHEHGLPLVLRTHPKEHEDGTLAAALPADEEGVSWARSRAHPFHLATRSRVGVTFLSGVAVDLIALGVPVIELLDVRGLPEHDGPSARRDEQGRVLFGPYRRDGLVIPADDIEDLRGGIRRTVEPTHDAVLDQQAILRNRFAGSQDAIVTMLGTLTTSR
jgi:hypothetical protein